MCVYVFHQWQKKIKMAKYINNYNDFKLIKTHRLILNGFGYK